MNNEVNWGIEFVKIAAAFIAAGGGAWLSIRVFPLQAKKDEWLWNRKIEALEFLFDTLSKIDFVTNNHIKSEYTTDISMSDLKSNEIENYIFSAVRKLNERSAGMALVLSVEQNTILSKYLKKSQSILDKSSATWGQWDEGNQEAIADHTNKTLSSLGFQAKKTLKKLKKTIEPTYNA